MIRKDTIFKLIELLDLFWQESECFEKNSKEYLIRRMAINRIKNIIKPCGVLRKYMSESGYLVTQFRYSLDDGINKAKHFNPGIYEIVKTSINCGDTKEQVLLLIENGGDREKSLGNDYRWVMDFEEKLRKLKLIE